jgi:hypothetical protein
MAKKSNLFELTEQTKAKLLNVEILSQKGRQPDENSGVKLTLEISLSNDYLSFFDGHLKNVLFERGPANNKGQAPLEGVPAVTDAPNLTKLGMRLGTLKWKDEWTGYSIVFDFGTGGKSNVTLKDCTVYGWKFTPKEGGAVIAKFHVDCADVPDPDFAKLRKWKCLEVFINSILPPEVQQGELAGVSTAPAPAPVASGKVKPATGEAAAPAPAAAAAAPAKPTAVQRDGGDGAWPFPTDGRPRKAEQKPAGDANPMTPEEALERAVASGPKPAAKKKGGRK